MEEYIVRMEGITKRFRGVVALDDVTFRVKKGSIHALVGENGAGKSTLMKIMSGVYPHGDYDGKLVINGEEQCFSDIKDSEKAGIAIIYQELNLVSTMTICENIFLGNERVRLGLINWSEQRQMARKQLERVKLDLPLDTKVGAIGVGKQQLVEIAKALCKKAEVLIFDEPTASLSLEDTENLFVILRELQENGVTCIYISHKLSEIFTVADTVTVLRDGRVITTKRIDEVDEKQLISYMVGRELTEQYPRVQHNAGETVLELKNWSVENIEIPGRKLINQVNLVARKGEILGISGLIGSGRTELAMSLIGAYPGKTTGQMLIDGKSVKIKRPREAIDVGISYLSEDRKRYGLVLMSDVMTNIAMPSYKALSRFKIINRHKEMRLAMDSVKRFNIKTPTIFQQAGNLSGGNQQKVILAKWVPTNPKVLIIDEPTRGIDVGSKAEIYQIMNQLVEAGMSIIMISSELPEILGMSDRIYVMREGEIVAELDYRNADQEKIMSFSSAQEKHQTGRPKNKECGENEHSQN